MSAAALGSNVAPSTTGEPGACLDFCVTAQRAQPLETRQEFAELCTAEGGVLAGWLVRQLEGMLDEDGSVYALTLAAQRLEALFNGASSALGDEIDSLANIRQRVFPKRGEA